MLTFDQHVHILQSFDIAFDFSVLLLSYQVDGCIDAV